MRNKIRLAKLAAREPYDRMLGRLGAKLCQDAAWGRRVRKAIRAFHASLAARKQHRKLPKKYRRGDDRRNVLVTTAVTS
jgi:hypothetical protein